MSLTQYITRKLHNLTHPVLGEIWMLHRVVERRNNDPKQQELEVTPQYLEQTINEYQHQGYRFVSIDEAVEILQKTHLSPFTFHNSPFICLTFDDGYHDNYTTALPLLKRLNVPFAVYITTGFIDNQLPMWWYPDQQLGLSLDELIALDHEPLCTIGAHTISHPRLDTLTASKQREEILDSKATLEKWLNHPIQHFSYPHGAYNNDTLAIVKSADFLSALCAWGGTVRCGDNPLLLHRIELRQQ